MNFFDHQDVARRNTRLLILLFGVAVVALVGLTVLVVAGVSGGMSAAESRAPGQPTEFRFHWDIMLATAGLVTSAISLAVLYKWAVLRPGGKVVAEHLGGRRLSPDSRDPLERKLLNVVEEMAIAANMPVPPVYLLDNEPGINAFAAGYSPQDAVIGITRGCAEKLTRSQLQGVVAHEIAHILNGDMRLNIRIMAVLNGILFISHAGYILLRMGAFSRGRNDKNPLPFIGIALLIIGAIGVLFGNIIKAAVSREREYLADASAVQFTREPEGIAGALQQIGAVQQGSQVESKNADEAAHLFFGQAVSRWMAMFATHPPLKKRIKRILPQWDGKFKANAPAQLQSELGADNLGPNAQAASTSTQSVSKERLARLALLAALPEALRDEARQQEGSEAMVFALMLSDEETTRSKQLALISQGHSPALAERAKSDFEKIRTLPLDARLPLVEIAMPALKSLAKEEKQSVLATLKAVKHADERVTLYEWCLAQLVERYLRADLKPNQHVPGVRLKAKTDAELTLSILAWFGHEDKAQAKRAFDAAAQVYGTALLPVTTQPFSFGDLADALDRIDRWSARDKERLVSAWVACCQFDGRMNDVERKLLFTLATCIGEPLPELPGDTQV